MTDKHTPAPWEAGRHVTILGLHTQDAWYEDRKIFMGRSAIVLREGTSVIAGHFAGDLHVDGNPDNRGTNMFCFAAIMLAPDKQQDGLSGRNPEGIAALVEAARDAKNFLVVLDHTDGLDSAGQFIVKALRAALTGVKGGE